METKEIQELLQAYAQHGSESAFRELVKRYITLVYSTALRQLIALIPSGGNSLTHSPLQDVTIRSGETTNVTIGESGYKISARFRFPAGVSRQSGMQFFASVHQPYPIPSAELMSDPEALKRWREISEIKRLVQMPNYQFREDSDGSWSAENVLPGSYEITVMAAVFEKSEPGKPVGSWHGKMNITVPETPKTGTIDAGEIELTLASAR